MGDERRRPPRWATLAAAALAASTAFGGSRGEPVVEEPPEPAPAAARVRLQGLDISFQLSRAEALSEATATFTITDEASGAPVRGLRPLGWMSRRRGAAAPDAAGCKAIIEGHLRGLLSERADVEMSGHDLWLLNREGTISVLDPTVAFARTKLASQIALPGSPGGWAMSQDRRSALVTIPEAAVVAVVDVDQRRVLGTVPVGKSPGRVLALPLGHRAFVANDGDDTVSVVDVTQRRVEQTLSAGRGRKEMALVDRGRAVFVTAAESEAAWVFDAGGLTEIARVPVPVGAGAIAASDAAGTVLVAGPTWGAITLVDTARFRVAGRFEARSGISTLGVDAAGRFAFALRRAAGEVSILDTASLRSLREIRELGGPDALAFTTGFAYVRRPREAKVSVIELATIDRPGSLAMVDVPIGQATSAPAERLPGAVMVPLPEGNGVLVTNPAEGQLYRYVEGMMAPVGSHKGPSRAVEGVMVVDRSLIEVAPGVYETRVRLPEAGIHDVALLLDRPRLPACLAQVVEPRKGAAPRPPESRFSIEPLFDTRARLPLDAPVTLRFRLFDEAFEGPVEPEDVEVFVLQAPGSDRHRLRPSDDGEGGYSITFTPRSPGQYRLLAVVESRRTPLHKAPQVTLNVGARKKERP